MSVVKQCCLCTDPVGTDMLSKACLDGYYPVALSATAYAYVSRSITKLKRLGTITASQNIGPWIISECLAYQVNCPGLSYWVNAHSAWLLWVNLYL